MQKKIKRFQRRYVKYQRTNLKRVKRLRRHPFIVPVITFLLLFFLALTGFVAAGAQTVEPSDAKVVQLYVDGEEQVVPTRAVSVGDLLQRLNIVLRENDIVEPNIETPIYDDNFTVNVYRAKPVTIVDEDGSKLTLLSAYQEPRIIAEKAGYTLFPEDLVQLERSENVLDEGLLGQMVNIDRATLVYINLYGTQITTRTHKTTVGEVLGEKNIQALEGDTVQPSLDTPVSQNAQVFVVRMGKQIVTEEVVIPAPVETIDDPNLALGKTEVREQGADGKKLVTYEIELENDQEVNRRVIQEVVATEPVKKVVAKGKRLLAVAITGSKADIMNAVGISAGEQQYVDYIISRESGWCATKWQGQYGQCPGYYQEIYSPSSSRGYGLCQSTPAIKMASFGSDWQINPVTQLKWCNNYAVTRYGSWAAAYNFWSVNHWW